MKTMTLTAPLTVGAGTDMILTAEQLRDRAHLVETVGTPRKEGTPVRSLGPVSFKAGEVVKIDEAKLPKGVAATVTAPAETGEGSEPAKDRAPSAKALDKARAEGVAAGRAAMLAEVEAYNTLCEAVDAAEEALARAEGDEGKAAAQKALDAANAAAEAAVPKA